MTTDSPGRQRGGRPAAEVFAVDLTAARGQCEGCGSVAPMAEARLYVHAPGLVLRCAGCDAVLLRLVSGAGRRWLDVRGLAYLQFADD